MVGPVLLTLGVTHIMTARVQCGYAHLQLVKNKQIFFFFTNKCTAAVSCMHRKLEVLTNSNVKEKLV